MSGPSQTACGVSAKRNELRSSICDHWVKSDLPPLYGRTLPPICRVSTQRHGPARRARLPGRFALSRRLLVVEQQVGHERVGLAFPTEGRGLAVPGHELDVIAEWPEPRADRCQELIVVAAWEIGAADRPPEQHV